MASPNLLTMKEMCALLKVGRHAVSRQVKRGHLLAPIKLGDTHAATIRFDADEVYAAIERFRR
jgi:predicted DNA-binding transcriptional regulator AlpA